MITLQKGLEFELPDALVARDPPEARGLERDGVRLLVSARRGKRLRHARFQDLAELLSPGDLVVVNASATFNAALEATRLSRPDGADREVLLHLSTPAGEDASPVDQLRSGGAKRIVGEHRAVFEPRRCLDAGGHVSGDVRWVVELRRRDRAGNVPLLDAEPGERLALPDGACARLVAPYVRHDHSLLPSDPERFGPSLLSGTSPGRIRLWVAALSLTEEVLTYTARHGSPIRYGYVPRRWPLSAYQTMFSSDPGSAEMPSAGRPFTPRLLARLGAAGVRVAPIVLHTGVSSLDADEPPYAERFRVPHATAELVNRTRAAGGRIVAVGTTSVRALESVADTDGCVRAAAGWTDLVVTPERGLRVVDAILTGLHGPSASHLAMLEALAGREHLTDAYQEALRGGYLWHEFGDSHLLLP